MDGYPEAKLQAFGYKELLKTNEQTSRASKEATDSDRDFDTQLLVTTQTKLQKNMFPESTPCVKCPLAYHSPQTRYVSMYLFHSYCWYFCGALLSFA
jgi:hypothetical protein